MHVYGDAYLHLYVYRIYDYCYDYYPKQQNMD